MKGEVIMNPKEQYQKNTSAILSKDFEDEVILLSMDGNLTDLEKVYIITGAAGIRIWKLLDRKRSAGEIKKIIINEFEVDPKKAENDLASFLNELKNKRLIKGGEV